MQSPEKFWDFSNRIYAREGVSASCLALQDRHGLDVNVLLYCCWYGVHYGRFDSDCFGSLMQLSEMWTDHVVRPLREIRRWLKREDHGAELNIPLDLKKAYREDIKAIELRAEQLEQDALETLVVTPVIEMSADIQRQHCLHNLRDYFGFLDVGVDADTRECIDQILAQVIKKKNDRHTVEQGFQL